MAQVKYKRMYAGPAYLELGKIIENGKEFISVHFQIPLFKEPKEVQRKVKVKKRG